jgi:hypothetical protein
MDGRTAYRNAAEGHRELARRASGSGLMYRAALHERAVELLDAELALDPVRYATDLRATWSRRRPLVRSAGGGLAGSGAWWTRPQFVRPVR